MFLRRMLLAFALMAGVLSVPATAAEKQAFTPEAFAAAQAAGQPILIEVYAPWCSTCTEQAAVLDEVQRQQKFKDLHVFRVDFDSQRAALRKFKAQIQSTLIAFKGRVETGRSIGDTDPRSIEALLDQAL